MHLVFFVLLGATLVFGLPASKTQTKLVGGHAVEILDHPYMVSVQLNGNHICGGTIVSNIYIFTAAHCTSGNDANHLSIRAGSKNKNNGGIVIDVKAVIEHDSYDHHNLDYDIAILELQTALPLSPGTGMDYIDLPEPLQTIPDKTVCMVTGWGAMAEGSSLMPAMLQGLEVPTIPQTTCKGIYAAQLTDRMICAGYTTGGQDICTGDTGGPLVHNGVMLGISSWSYGCARPNFPGVYLKVSLVREWILNIIGI